MQKERMFVPSGEKWQRLQANKLYLTTFSHRPRGSKPGRITLAPYQQLLPAIAGPDMVAYPEDSPDGVDPRSTYILFCTSTGSGKTMTIWNSAWQYATCPVPFTTTHGTVVKDPFKVFIIAPPSALDEILSQVCSLKKPVPVEGLRDYVIYCLQEFEREHPTPKGKEADPNAKARTGYMKDKLARRNVHLLNYRQLCNHMSRHPKKSSEYPELCLPKLKKNVVFIFDEAHALIDTPGGTKDIHVKPEHLRRVRDRLHKETVSACIACTWTLTTVGVPQAVNLLVTLRGSKWAKSQTPPLVASDWPESLPTNFTKNRYLQVDSAAQDELVKLVNLVGKDKLRCPLETKLPSTALSVGSAEDLLDLLNGMVFYYDASPNLQRVLREEDILPQDESDPEESRSDAKFLSRVLRVLGYNGPLKISPKSPAVIGGGTDEFHEWYERIARLPGGPRLLRSLRGETWDAHVSLKISRRKFVEQGDEGKLRAKLAAFALPELDEDIRPLPGLSRRVEWDPGFFWSTPEYKEREPAAFARRTLEEDYHYSGEMPKGNLPNPAFVQWCRDQEDKSENGEIWLHALHDSLEHPGERRKARTGRDVTCEGIEESVRSLSGESSADAVVPSRFGWRSLLQIPKTAPSEEEVRAAVPLWDKVAQWRASRSCCKRRSSLHLRLAQSRRRHCVTA